MESEKNPSLLTIITNILIAYFKRLTDLIHLAGLETRLAIKTLITISILLFIIIILLVSTWLCCLLIIFSYLISLHYSWVFSACLLTIFNIVLMAIVFCCILIIKKNLFFPALRRQIKNDV
jgi:hypothetical protein